MKHKIDWTIGDALVDLAQAIFVLGLLWLGLNYGFRWYIIVLIIGVIISHIHYKDDRK